MKNKFCLVCGKELTKKQIYNNQQCCSPQCSAKNPSKKQKMKKTIKEKYGVEHFSKSNSFAEKIKNTWKQKSQEEIDEFNKNCEKTHLERYGCKRPLQKSQFKEKAKQTNLEKYGVENPFQVEFIKDKIKETNIEKYGVDNPQKSKQIINKTKKSFRKKFLKKLIEKFKDFVIPLFDENEYDNIRNKYKWQCIKCGNIFEQNIHKNQIDGKIEYVPRCLKCYPHLSGYSFLEKEVVDFIKSIYQGEIITNNRKILKGKELDIYLPNENLAIQFNGLYWHSKKDKNYHLNKTELCQKQNIRLIHVFQNEWKEYNLYIKKMIKSILKVYDENVNVDSQFIKTLNIKKINFNDVFIEFDIKTSIYMENSISRLISALKRNYDGDIIISLDRRYEDGKNYEKLGFELIKKTKPELMKINNYDIYNCGRLIYKLRRNK